MTKFKLYYDKDAETAWLNEMAQKGFALKSFFLGFYRFEACEPGEYIYQIDFTKGLYSVEASYQEFMEEMGAEIISCWGPWVFLRKKASEGAFDLYTDTESLITHYTKIRNMFKFVTILELLCFFLELYAALNGFEMGILFMFLLGMIAITCARMASHTNALILKLNGKGRENSSSKCGARPISLLLSSGIMLNLCALAIRNPSLHTAKIAVQIFAIVLMLVGIYRTARARV